MSAARDARCSKPYTRVRMMYGLVTILYGPSLG